MELCLIYWVCSHNKWILNEVCKKSKTKRPERNSTMTRSFRDKKKNTCSMYILYLSSWLQQYLPFNKRQVFQKFSIIKMHFNICTPLWTASFSNNSFFFVFIFITKSLQEPYCNEFWCYFQIYNSPVNRLCY